MDEDRGVIETGVAAGGTGGVDGALGLDEVEAPEPPLECVLALPTLETWVDTTVRAARWAAGRERACVGRRTLIWLFGDFGFDASASLLGALDLVAGADAGAPKTRGDAE
ncbi:MAG TPA: hypothetical protein VIK04_21275 [Solirubrobacteraceae bacterium]